MCQEKVGINSNFLKCSKGIWDFLRDSATSFSAMANLQQLYDLDAYLSFDNGELVSRMCEPGPPPTCGEDGGVSLPMPSGVGDPIVSSKSIE